MTKEEFIAEQKQKIAALTKEQKKLLREWGKVSNLPPSKRLAVQFRRLRKLMGNALKVQSIEVQKQIIASQPYPIFKEGGMRVGGMVQANTGEVFDAPVIYDK